jgi:hypothetical protein
MLMRIYIFLAALLVRAIVKYCTARKRYVDYVHSEPFGESGLTERTYMRRYVIFGFMTGDAHPNTIVRSDLLERPQHANFISRAWDYCEYGLSVARRWYALNRWHLYLHHMHAPDADACLHDHPWPWGLSWVLLGGYREARLQAPNGFDPRAIYVPERTFTHRWLRAPALNVLHGTTFHRISELRTECYPCALNQCDMFGRVAAGGNGVFTLFLAGPRSKSKPWGYLVPGRGFVPQRERHAEMGAREVRAK